MFRLDILFISYSCDAGSQCRIYGFVWIYFTKPGLWKLGLDEEKINVCFRNEGDLSIYGLANSSRMCAFSPVPNLCVLMIGGNNATTRPTYLIAQDIVSYANYLLHRCGIKSVIIGQLLRRDPRKSPFGYNEEVIHINKQLENLTSS